MRQSMHIGIFVVLFCGSCSRASDVCDLLTSIARDSKRMDYAKNWIGARLTEPAFRETLKTRHVLRGPDDRFQEFGRFDWQYFGVSERYGEIVFNMPIKTSKQWDTSKVHSVSIDLGRSFILLNLGSTADLKLTYDPEDVAKMKAVSDGVFVYCGYRP